MIIGTNTENMAALPLVQQLKNIIKSKFCDLTYKITH